MLSLAIRHFSGVFLFLNIICLKNFYSSSSFGLYVIFPHDVSPNIPRLPQDSAGSSFMCIHNILQCITTFITIYFTISLFFLGDYRFLKATFALFIYYCILLARYRHTKTTCQIKEMNWHIRTKTTHLLCSTQKRTYFFLCSESQELC